VLAEWLEGVRAQGRALVSLDPNVRPSLIGDTGRFRQRLARLLRCSHVVKVSTEDLGVIAPGTDPLEVAQQWLSHGPHLVVVTQGPDGATAVHRSGASAHCAAPPVQVADTIGAGDSFSAGLLAYFADNGLLDPTALAHVAQDQLQAAVSQAVAVSALTCTRPGADPPTRAELDAFFPDD
jgi:fructokinase